MKKIDLYTVLGLKMIAWLSIKYNERNRNVYLGKVWAQMYTMKSPANEPTFSKNERKCAATAWTCFRSEQRVMTPGDLWCAEQHHLHGSKGNSSVESR